MKRTIRGLLAASLIAVLGFLTPGPVMAANINIFDGPPFTPEGTVAVQTSQFELGVSVTHMNIFGGEDDVRITGSFFTNSQAGLTGGGTMFMIEPPPLGPCQPGSPPGCGFGTVSDIVAVSWSTRAGGEFNIADITVDFASDPAQCEPNLCGTGQGLIENGTLQNVNAYLDLPANITINVQSDVVPEPATLLLLGSGLAGLAVWRKMKKS